MPQSERFIPVSSQWLAPSDYNQSEDPLGIDDLDHVEIFVGNARQAAFYYAKGFGFSFVAYRGPETGVPEAASYLLQQGNAKLVFTSPLSDEHISHSLTARHGDTVRSIALKVSCCTSFYSEALKRGAESALAPVERKDSNGSIIEAAIRTYGDTLHTIIEHRDYSGPFLPGFAPARDFFHADINDPLDYIVRVDHMVGNVELGKMDTWVKFYEDVLGFQEMLHFTEEDISTEYSALMSKVMRGGNGKIKFPINEPADGKRKSQIEEYLDFHRGPGVQHVAFETTDIIKTVTELRSRGIEFLNVPHTYYEELPSRIGDIKEDIDELGKLGILADRDDDGYLLQIFTQPVQDRPTLFYEFIQREGSHGFGQGNFKALFEAIEREQAKRGNL